MLPGKPLPFKPSGAAEISSAVAPFGKCVYVDDKIKSHDLILNRLITRRCNSSTSPTVARDAESAHT